MSYKVDPDDKFHPSTPMPYDIAALQYIYGANMTTRAGDTVYKWAPGEQIFETIWDAGGKDTLDWSNQTTAAKINLSAGAWSELGPANYFGARTLAIAERVSLETARGGSGNDELNGNTAANGLYGNGGTDLIRGNSGVDTIDGGTGNDTLYGDAGNDLIRGGDGEDEVFGGHDNDTVYGGNDPDWLNGQWGNDTIYGEAGNDIFIGEDGADKLFGGDGDDWFTGGASGDELSGGFGQDEMYGDAGNDKLSGGEDNDTLSGGAGMDQLTGGFGNDRFGYDLATDSRPGATLRDVINDFTAVGPGDSDRIDVANIDANTGVAGNQAFKFLGAGAFTSAGQIRVKDAGTDTLIQANTDPTMSTIEMEILVKNVNEATAADWVIGDFYL